MDQISKDNAELSASKNFSAWLTANYEQELKRLLLSFDMGEFGTGRIKLPRWLHDTLGLPWDKRVEAYLIALFRDDKDIPPVMLPAFISAFMHSIKGCSTDSGDNLFYEGMFCVFATNVTVLLDAFDRSETGSLFATIEPHLIYRVDRIYEMMVNEKSLMGVIQVLLDEVEINGADAKPLSRDVVDAIEYFNGCWQEIPPEIKNGLMTAVRERLGWLRPNNDCESGFFAGRHFGEDRIAQAGGIQ